MADAPENIYFELTANFDTAGRIAVPVVPPKGGGGQADLSARGKRTLMKHAARAESEAEPEVVDL